MPGTIFDPASPEAGFFFAINSDFGIDD